MRCYGVATRGIVLGDRADVCDARAFSDLLRCPKSPSQCLIVRCRPSDGRASPSVVEVSGNKKRPMPAVQYIQWASSIKYAIGRMTRSMPFSFVNCGMLAMASNSGRASVDAEPLFSMSPDLLCAISLR